MGYTHYWYRKKEFDCKKFEKAVTDCKIICNKLPIPLALGDEAESPAIFEKDIVNFNGGIDKDFSYRNPENWGDLYTYIKPVLRYYWISEEGYQIGEPFYMPKKLLLADLNMMRQFRTGYWLDFCKVREYPYGLDVQCCLIIFKKYLSDDIKVISDGRNIDWMIPKIICQKILGYGNDFKLEQEYA